MSLQNETIEEARKAAPAIRAKPYTGEQPPRRVLAIRLQAMGDTVGTLPFLQDLRKTLPATTQLDLLTRKETDSIPRNIFLFDKVYSIGGERSFKKQVFFAGLLLPALLLRRYDVVLDLQNNILTRMIRQALAPSAWVEYDRFSPISGAERYRLTIEAAGLGSNKADTHFRLKDPTAGMALLRSKGHTNADQLVVLNPAGAFETRHWPLENYIGFARKWLAEYPMTKFLVLGTSFISDKALILETALGDRLINLVEQTTTIEAFSILQHAFLMLSEDSGLMHMAWLSGIPTLALFGSTRSDWSRPLGDHTFLLDSSDLPCGNCMQATCQFGDTHCLTRYSAEEVYRQASALLARMQTQRLAKLQTEPFGNLQTPADRTWGS